MALDSAAKRGSAVSYALPYGTIPLPDGTISVLDRQHVAFSYAGIDTTLIIVYGHAVATDAVLYAATATDSSAYTVTATDSALYNAAVTEAVQE